MNFSKTKKVSFIFMAIIFLIMPIFTYSQTTEPPSDTGITYECSKGAPGECEFEDLLAAVRKVVNYATSFAIFFSVVVIAYAGFELMISGDNASKRSDAKKRLGKVVIGIIFIIAAWLIVSLILRALGTNSVVDFG